MSLFERHLNRVIDNAPRVALGVTSALILFRGLWTLSSGFLTGDEAGYMWSMITTSDQGSFFFVTWRHLAFNLINGVVALLFHIESFPALTVYFTLQALFWNALGLWMFDKVLRLYAGERARHMTLLTLPLTASFLIMQSMFLAEAAGLFFALTSVYCMIRLLRGGENRFGFAASASASIAYMFREPYLLLVVFLGLYMLLVALKGKVPKKVLVLFIIPALILVRPPTDVLKLPFKIDPVSVFERILYLLKPTTAPIGIPLNDPTSTSNLPPTLVNPTTDIAFPLENRPAFEYLYPDEFGFKHGFTLERLLTLPPRVAVFVVRSLSLGWTLFFPITLASLGLLVWKHRNGPDSSILFVAVLCGFLMVAFVGLLIVDNDYLMSPEASSIAFRFSHNGLLAFLALPFLYERLSNKHLKIGLVGGLMLAIILAPSLAYGVQSNLSTGYVNRLTIAYKSPQQRLRQYVINQEKPIIVFIEPAMRAGLLLRGIDNVVLKRVQVDHARFEELYNASEGNVVLYIEKWYGINDVLKDNSPFFQDLLNGSDTWQLETVTDDPEWGLYHIRRVQK
ncbi:MAG: hypothetical protein KJ578_15865 [Bacteroidetes bacterium]|nr:hypothetical protein [Bacteroidota bacterium]